MKTNVYILEGLDCENTASKLEQEIRTIKGLKNVSIIFATKQMHITAENPDAFMKEIEEVIAKVEPGVAVTKEEIHNHRIEIVIDYHHHKRRKDASRKKTRKTKRIMLAAVWFCVFVMAGLYYYRTVLMAAEMCLAEYEGTVTVFNSKKEEIPLKEQMPLYSGYMVKTGSDGIARILLDDTKLILLSADGQAEIESTKGGKHLTITADPAEIFFAITEKLEEDETLYFKNRNSVLAIRGTVGFYRQTADNASQIAVLEGTIEISDLNQNTTKKVSTGQMADFTVQSDGNVEVKGREILSNDIPAFVSDELAQNEEAVQQIEENGGTIEYPEKLDFSYEDLRAFAFKAAGGGASHEIHVNQDGDFSSILQNSSGTGEDAIEGKFGFLKKVEEGVYKTVIEEIEMADGAGEEDSDGQEAYRLSGLRKGHEVYLLLESCLHNNRKRFLSETAYDLYRKENHADYGDYGLGHSDSDNDKGYNGLILYDKNSEKIFLGYNILENEIWEANTAVIKTGRYMCEMGESKAMLFYGTQNILRYTDANTDSREYPFKFKLSSIEEIEEHVYKAEVKSFIPIYENDPSGYEYNSKNLEYGINVGDTLQFYTEDFDCERNLSSELKETWKTLLGIKKLPSVLDSPLIYNVTQNTIFYCYEDYKSAAELDDEKKDTDLENEYIDFSFLRPSAFRYIAETGEEDRVFIDGDGNFSGEAIGGYDTSRGGPYITYRFYCAYTGKFSKLERVDDLIYKATVEELVLKYPLGTEKADYSMSNGYENIVINTYVDSNIKEGDEVFFYLEGFDLNELSERDRANIRMHLAYKDIAKRKISSILMYNGRYSFANDAW